jgi:hypothetical protein
MPEPGAHNARTRSAMPEPGAHNARTRSAMPEPGAQCQNQERNARTRSAMSGKCVKKTYLKNLDMFGNHPRMS